MSSSRESRVESRVPEDVAGSGAAVLAGSELSSLVSRLLGYFAVLCLATGCLGRPMQGAYPYGSPQFVTLPGPVAGPPSSPTPVPISTPQPSPPPGPVASPPQDQPINDGGLSLTPASRKSASTWPRYPVRQTPTTFAPSAPPSTFAPSVPQRTFGPLSNNSAVPYAIGNTSYSRPISGDSRPNARPVAYSAENSAALPATPGEDLRYRGGKTIRDLTYINIYVGGPQAWAESDRKNIDWALNAAMIDPHLNHVLMQYFNDQPISANYRGSFLLNGYSPTRVTQSNMRQLVSSLDQMGSFSQLPAGSAAINFILPRGVVLEDPSLGSVQPPSGSPIPSADEGNSLKGLAGYHGSVKLGARTLYYSVAVYSERLPNGQTNGVPVFEVPWKDICATLYHQLQEIRTDPDSDDAISSGNQQYVGWASDRGEEISDLPVKADSADGQLDQVFREVPLANGSARVPVQLMYSNAVHGPEGPIAQPHKGSPLPVPEATVPPWGSTPGPTPDPTPDPAPTDPPPQTADPGLEWIRKEWHNLPDSLKQRILELIRQSQANAEEQPFGS